LTTHHSITFELYLNVQTVISGPSVLVCFWPVRAANYGRFCQWLQSNRL